MSPHPFLNVQLKQRSIQVAKVSVINKYEALHIDIQRDCENHHHAFGYTLAGIQGLKSYWKMQFRMYSSIRHSKLDTNF